MGWLYFAKKEVSIIQIFTVSGIITLDDRQIQQITRQIENLESSIAEAAGRMSESISGLGNTGFFSLYNHIGPTVDKMTEFTSTILAFRKARKDATIAQEEANIAQATAKTAVRDMILGKTTQATVTKSQTAAMIKQTKATKAATIATAAKNKVMKANPIGLVIGALSMLAGTLLSASTNTNSATNAFTELRDAVNSLLESIEASAKARDAMAESMAVDAMQARNLWEQILELNEVFDKSLEQRATMYVLVNHLNSVFEGLNLQYDMETGYLSGNLELIDAQIKARNELNEIEFAQESLIEIGRERYYIERLIDEAIADRDDALKNSISTTQSAFSVNSQFRLVIEGLQREIEDLAKQEEEHNKTLMRFNITRQDSSIALAENIKISEAATDATEYARRISERAAQGLTRYTYTLTQATSSADRLNRAQNELNDTNQLSINTITDMINNGYALALRIDAETGAVTLCTDEYLRLANARIDEKIASKQIKRDEIVAALISEANLVMETGAAYEQLAYARFKESLAQDESIVGLDAQMAALRRLRGEMNQTSTATQRNTDTIITAARDRVTAEREAFDAINAYLERRIFFEDITAKEIYEIRKNSLEQFVGDVEVMEKAERELFTARNNLENDYLSNRQRIFGLHEDALSRMKAAEERFTEAVNNRARAIFNSALQMADINRLLVDSTETRTDAVIAAEKRVHDIEARISDLREAEFENELQRQEQLTAAYEERTRLQEALAEAEYQAQKTNAQLIAESLEETIANMKRHAEYMDYILANTNISKEFLDEMRLLEPGAINELATLRHSCKDELAHIADLFGEMQKLARDRAEEELQGMREDVNQEIKSIYEELNKTINTEAPETGANMVLGMIEGVNDNIDELMDTMRNMAGGTLDAVKDALDMRSPSREFKKIAEGGVFGMIDGFRGKERGLHNALMEVLRRITGYVDAFMSREGFVAGRSFASELGQGLMSQQASLLTQAMAQAEAIRAAFAPTPTIPSAGGFQAAGSFAHGLGFVPYDGFPAYLHRGEMVLTSKQAAEYRGENGGNTFIQNFYGVQERETGYKAYRGYQKAQALLGV